MADSDKTFRAMCILDQRAFQTGTFRKRRKNCAVIYYDS